jgi:hypothetical protein
MPITGEGRIRNTRERILRSATFSQFATITTLRNLPEPQERQRFCEASNQDWNVFQNGARSAYCRFASGTAT